DVLLGGKFLWVVADNGVFFCAAKGETPLTKLESLEGLGAESNVCTSGDNLCISGSHYIYRLRGLQSSWDPKFTVTRSVPAKVYADNPPTFVWTIQDYGGRTSRELVKQRVILKDSDNRDISIPEGSEVLRGSQNF